MALTKEQKEWIEKIKKDAVEFENVPQELVTEEFCLTAAQANFYALGYIPKEFLKEEMCIAFMREDGDELSSLPPLMAAVPPVH